MERLAEKLARGDFVVTAEVDPPRGGDASPLLQRVGCLVGLVDAVNVTDCPRANVRMSSIAAAHLIERAVGLETVFHLTCRDRNVIGLQADLLGAAALGLRNLLVLSGDPPAQGQHPEARGVYELDAPGLIRLVATLNGGTTAAGKPLEGANPRFCVAVAANPTASDLEREASRLAEKVAAGGSFVQTQPVFDLETVEAFEAALSSRGLRVPVLYGLLPLRDPAFARRMAAIPGVRVPERVMRRLEEGGPEEGRRLAAELAGQLAAVAAGIHVFPMGDLEAVRAIAEALGGRRGRAPRRAAGLGGG